MAVTKIHPIKSTLKKALDYIENPAKTDEKMLVSSFACSYETADIEFELLLSQAMQKGNNLAHHLIQSFAPGETTPERAHEIGRQLADEVLQGKYPYVLTTHIDKGHVHNHIIFCAVDMVNQRKYVSNRQSYEWMYMLVDSVTIPERSFIRASFDTGKATLENICKEAVDGIILKKWTAQEAADYIGKWAVEMTHDYFNTKLSPPKSATTQLTSTQYQPLFDTGRLYNSISYSVEGI